MGSQHISVEVISLALVACHYNIKLAAAHLNLKEKTLVNHLPKTVKETKSSKKWYNFL
jgi:ActR/RegA family two-component response regulator